MVHINIRIIIFWTSSSVDGWTLAHTKPYFEVCAMHSPFSTITFAYYFDLRSTHWQVRMSKPNKSFFYVSDKLKHSFKCPHDP